MILGTRLSILGTRIGSLKHLKKPWSVIRRYFYLVTRAHLSTIIFSPKHLRQRQFHVSVFAIIPVFTLKRTNFPALQLQILEKWTLFSPVSLPGFLTEGLKLGTSGTFSIGYHKIL